MQKGQTLIFLLVGIVILAVVAGGAYYLGTKNKTLSETVSEQNPVIWPVNSPEPDNKPNPDISTLNKEDEIANWKTFTNNQKNIMFKYPPIWKVEETHGGGGDPDAEFSFFPLNVTPDIRVGDHIGNSEMIIVIQPQVTPRKNKNDQLLQNKYPILKPDGKTGSVTVVYNEAGTIGVHFIFTEKAQPYLDQILSTFKFIP